jgi:hypothetical protein
VSYDQTIIHGISELLPYSKNGTDLNPSKEKKNPKSE